MADRILTPSGTSDEAIIEKYFARDEQAIRDTERRFGSYLFRLAFNVLHNREDSEECCSDAYLALWNAIPPARPDSLAAFAASIVRRIAVGRWRTRTREKRVPSELTVSLEDLFESETDDALITDETDAGELVSLLNAFVRGLPENDRYIFISRWYEACPVSDIASELSVTPSAVYKAIARLRAALKAYLERNGITI